MLEANLQYMRTAEIQARKRAKKAKLQGAKMLGQVTKMLKCNTPAPMTALRRPANMGPGKPKGSLATHPKERDQILHMAWDPITKGNVSDRKASADMFCRKYARHIPTLPQFPIGDLTVASFKATCQAGKKIGCWPRWMDGCRLIHPLRQGLWNPSDATQRN